MEVPDTARVQFITPALKVVGAVRNERRVDVSRRSIVGTSFIAAVPPHDKPVSFPVCVPLIHNFPMPLPRLGLVGFAVLPQEDPVN